jgi:hypothetical protein
VVDAVVRAALFAAYAATTVIQVLKKVSTADSDMELTLYHS